MSTTEMGEPRRFGFQASDRHPRERIQLYMDGNLFTPNKITRDMAWAMYIQEGDVVVEIGTGIGALAILAAKRGAAQVHGVDIVEEQIDYARANAELNGLTGKVEFYSGNLFEPLPAEVRANVIIADVSAVPRGISDALGWYPGDVPAGGEDGTEHIVPLLEAAGDFMHPDGRVYFPVGSIADHLKIMDAARSNFGYISDPAKVEKVISPADMALLAEVNDGAVKELMRAGVTPFGEGRGLWKAWYYEARDPI